MDTHHLVVTTQDCVERNQTLVADSPLRRNPLMVDTTEEETTATTGLEILSEGECSFDASFDEDNTFVSPPLSPRSENYRLKRIYLQCYYFYFVPLLFYIYFMYGVNFILFQEKYNYVQESTDRLRNRLYHVKTEISYLKRLKRVLINRLAQYGDEYFYTPLEIPDDTGSDEPASKKRRERRERERERKEAMREAARKARIEAESSSALVSPAVESIIKEARQEIERQAVNSKGSSLALLHSEATTVSLTGQ
uniref:BHLH domain-containing protein n=1 Tax=Heterorhabditis bacteriophora TaxID=37862 RepID=A0A1I7XQV1_HETBA